MTGGAVCPGSQRLPGPGSGPARQPCIGLENSAPAPARSGAAGRAGCRGGAVHPPAPPALTTSLLTDAGRGAEHRRGPRLFSHMGPGFRRDDGRS